MNGATRKILSYALALTVVATSFVSFITPISAKKELVFTPLEFDYDKNHTYQKYSEENKESEVLDGEIVIPATSYTLAEDGKVSVVSYNGKENVLKTSDDPVWFEYSVNVPSEGLYNIYYEICGSEESKNDIQFGVEINGESPFNEAKNFIVYRGWTDNPKGLDEDGNFARDTKDNDLRPSQVLSLNWRSGFLEDSTGMVKESFKFRFKAGVNTIRIKTAGDVFYVNEFKLMKKPELKSYKEVSEEYKQKGYKAVGQDIVIKKQLEKTKEKSNTTLYAIPVRQNSSLEPSDITRTRLNVIGGTNWKSAGQWISWDVQVPESGLYQLTFKYRQNTMEGMHVTRELYIDGEIPFKEFEDIEFHYDNVWKQKVLGNQESNEPYLVYLEKGNHEFKMKVTLGDISEVIGRLNDVVFELNEIYRKIIMISGTTPDSIRDYKFDSVIPDLVDTLKKNSDAIKAQANELTKVSNTTGKQIATLTEYAIKLDGFVKKPNSFNKRLSTYKDGIATLSQWVIDNQNQPLEFDYLILSAPGIELPATEPGFFRGMWDDLKAFFASFTEDYSVISDINSGEMRKVRVWVGTGRDQVSIINSMINDLFTPKTGIAVQLELVQGSLIEATLAGRGPDIGMMVASDQPVNYAIRGALVDLSQYEDFEEVTSRFTKAAMTPYEFLGGYYALPESQTYNMMFYRKDILAELELGVPETWDDFFAILPVLNRNNLVVGVGDQLMFQTLLYQNGGSYYKEDKKSTAFDSDVAKEAFRQVVECYTKYSFPKEFDFYTRFRNGEMPIGINPYTEYNRLNTAAPEIKGLWDMAPVPGVRKEDGTIDRSGTSGVSGMIMFNGTEDKDAAWEYMKWHTSSEAQTRYGLELEGLLGPAGRYATANKEAFGNLTWSREQSDILNLQWAQVKGVPELPGSYYTTRGLNNAFKTSVYDSHENPYKTLYEWNKDINEEISRKYEEFGIE